MSVQKQAARRPSWEGVITWFISGQAISQLGSAIVQFALIWYITTSTDSGTMMMVMTVVSFVPQLLIAVFAGVWADRFNRKWLIILPDVGIALVTLVIAVCFYFQVQNLWLIFVVAAIRSLGGGIQGPASTAMVPQLVPRSHLVRVNGIQGTISNLVQFLSPVMAGSLLTVMPLFHIFFIDVVTALIAVVIMFFLPLPSLQDLAMANGQMAGAETGHHGTEPVIDSHIDSLRQGLAYIRKFKLIFRLMSVYGGFMVLLAPTITLLPLYIKRNFGEESWRLSIAQTALFAGLVVGGLIVSAIGRFENKIRVIQRAGVGLAIMIVCLGLIGGLPSPVFSLLVVVAFLAGTVVPFYLTNVTVLLQEEVAVEYHGRVFAVLYMIGSAAVPLGALLFGPVADVLPIQTILFATGALQVLLVLVSRRLFPAKPSDPPTDG